MTDGEPASRFAPAERATEEIVTRQSRLLAAVPFLQQLYDAVTDIVVILNPQRQIVFCNRRLAEALGVDDRRKLCGLRLGEAIGCHYARLSQGGCGTSEFCEACGALDAVLVSQCGDESARECSILRDDGQEPLDLLVRATPLELGEKRFSVVAATDISHEKRRKALERAFFHDLMNTALGLMFAARELVGTPPERTEEAARRIQDVVRRLLEEVQEQRDLAAAENRDLAARPVNIRARPFLEGLMRLYRRLADERGCRFVMAARSQDTLMKSDPTLLGRVLGNMIKNALEASGPDQTVTVGCKPAGGKVEFWVRNDGVMPRKVQHRIFQRSFSTKGVGHGLGTYSMKLLSERYLKGTVTFTSSPQRGTVFTASFPPTLEGA